MNVDNETYDEFVIESPSLVGVVYIAQWNQVFFDTMTRRWNSLCIIHGTAVDVIKVP